MFHQHFPHWKVIDVGGGERGSDPFRRSRDQAVSLVQRDALLSERTTPDARPPALSNTKRGQPKCIEKATRSGTFIRPQTPPNLLDRYDAHPRLYASATQVRHTCCGWTASKRIDQNGGIEQQSGHHSTGSAIVAAPLTPHPICRIVVPIVTGTPNPAQCFFDVVPTPFIVKSASDELGDKGAALAGACATIQFRHQGVGQCNVYSHGSRIAHNLKDGTRHRRMPFTVPSMERSSEFLAIP